jgi:SAM-dependent methyltransferase
MNDDIFGQALYDYHRGDRKSIFEWIRDDKTHTVQDISGYYEGFTEFELVGMDFAQSDILDVGCGAGKHVLEFQKKGLTCVGIDVSPLAIDVCLDRRIENCLLADVFDNGFSSQRFGAITLFSNNLSIGGTMSGVNRLIAELARITKPGGVLISFNLDVAQGVKTSDAAYRAANVAAGRPEGQIRMQGAYKGKTGDWFDWLFVAPAMLNSWATPHGWSLDRVIDGPGNGDYCAILTRR